jgi:hypothetical protein
MRALVVLALLLLGGLVYLFVTHEKVAVAGLGRFRFVDVAKESGLELVNVSGDPRRWYIPESNGNGAAWFDFEGDGDLDVFIGNGQHLRYHDDGARLEVVRDAKSALYLNQGFLRFRDASFESGADRRDWVNGIAVGDIDNDGDPDLYLACFGADVLLVKEGNRFVESTKARGLGNELWAASACFGDANRDGQLDLYVANYCQFDLEHPPASGKRNVIEGVEVAWGPIGENKQYNPGAPDLYFQNDGRGGFADRTEAAGFRLEQPLCSYGCVWSDVTGDGWPDLLVANDLEPANLFVNQGNGLFREEGVARGFALNAEGKPTSGMAHVVEDIDDDGDFDVLRTNFDMEPNSLFLNDGKGNFVERAGVFGLAEASFDKLGWDAAFLDADRDGHLELVVANGHVYPQAEKIGLHPWLQTTQLFAGEAHLSYGTVWKDATAEAGPGFAPLRSARGIAVADPDDDGDPDLLIVDLDGPPRFLRNDSPKRGHWLGLELIGKQSNRDALGARVELRSGDKTWTREVRATSGLYSSRDRRLLFGLGERKTIDSITVRWPSGSVQVEKEIPLDRYHKLVEHVEGAR